MNTNTKILIVITGLVATIATAAALSWSSARVSSLSTSGL